MSYALLANVSTGRHSRRTLLGAAIAASLVQASARIGSAQPATGGRTYLAELENGLHVAVVVSTSEAMAFVTDGSGRADAFTGASGRSMTLDGADGSRITASFGAEGFEGWVANADGSGFSFLAPEANGVAGLYEVEFTEGYVSGSCTSGASLTGGIVRHFDEGGALIQGLIIRSGSRSRPFVARVSEGSWGVQRWIVHETGTVAGGCSDGSGYGFAAPAAQSA